MLIPYDPIIPHDPRRVISHRNEVSRLRCYVRMDC